HPWLGVLTLFGLRGYGEIPYRGMIVSYEHHMKTDLTGYPKSLRPRDLSIYSKIVAVADGFDAATSRRAYQTVPIQPDQVLKEMWENPRRGYDQIVVKAFINLIGIYPVGTCVILDTYEVALVHSANPDVTHVHRPVVRIVTTPERGVPDTRGVARSPAAPRRGGCGLHGGGDPVLGSLGGRAHHPALHPGRAGPGHDGAARARPDPSRRARDPGGGHDVLEPADGL